MAISITIYQSREIKKYSFSTSLLIRLVMSLLQSPCSQSFIIVSQYLINFRTHCIKLAFSACGFFGKFFQIAIFQNVFWTVSSYYWEMMKQKYQKLLISRLVSFRSFLFVFSLLIATLEVMKATTIYILTHHPLSIFYKRPWVQIIFRKYYHAARGEFRTL